MRFLMTLYQIQDYGGIINHLETLTDGLRMQGHEVDFKILVPKERVQQRLTSLSGIEDGWRVNLGGTGYPFHQQKGWGGVPRIPYLGEFNVNAFKRMAGGYDAVFWHIPVPTLAKDNAGITDWLRLYDHGAPNYAIIHDGNLPKLYPHIAEVQQHFQALICVHESAYASAATIGLPRILIPNPFKFDAGFTTAYMMRSGFVAVQVFKAWKRVDSLIRAIPHMKNEGRKVVGGGGIEQRYMVSLEKCKPAYMNEDGTRIWDEALKAGMEYTGFIPNDDVGKFLNNARVHIDPSWSHKYAAYGAHFNRTTIEAMIHDCVPMATDLGMKNSEFFKPGVNYVEIPHNATPKEFAQLVDDTLENRRQAGEIRNNNCGLLEHFNYLEVAARYVWLARNTLPVPEYRTQQSILDASAKNMEFFRT